MCYERCPAKKTATTTAMTSLELFFSNPSLLPLPPRFQTRQRKESGTAKEKQEERRERRSLLIRGRGRKRKGKKKRRKRKRKKNKSKKKQKKKTENPPINQSDSIDLLRCERKGFENEALASFPPPSFRRLPSFGKHSLRSNRSIERQIKPSKAVSTQVVYADEKDKAMVERPQAVTENLPVGA